MPTAGSAGDGAISWSGWLVVGSAFTTVSETNTTAVRGQERDLRGSVQRQLRAWLAAKSYKQERENEPEHS